MRRTLRAFIIGIALLIALSSLCPALAVTPTDWSADNPSDLQEGHLFAQSAIAIDYNTGEVLFSKNPDARMFPASTTKIMTLLLALESGIPLETEITVPQEAVDIPKDSSTIPISAGEVLTFEDLLYGFMMRSGNDGAIAIAITCSGSVNAFVAAMNQRAADLGCTNTHFSNPHGYHENDHYTSARDLSLISREAMKYETFRKIVSTPTYIMKATNVHSKREITSRVDMINPSSKYYVQECIGIKTGFTRKAGQCFVGAAKRNGRVVITVALFSTIDYEGRKWFDTNCMFQYCFTRYDQYTIADLFEMSGEGLKYVTVENAAQDDPQAGRLDLILSQTSDDGYTLMALQGTDEFAAYQQQFNDSTQVTFTTDYLNCLEQRQPIQAGSIVAGFSTVTQEGETITGALIASRSVNLAPLEVSMWDYLTEKIPFLKVFEDTRTIYLLIAAAVILVLIIILIAVRTGRRNRRRKRIYEQRRRAYYQRMRQENQTIRNSRGSFPRPENDRKSRK